MSSVAEAYCLLTTSRSKLFSHILYDKPWPLFVALLEASLAGLKLLKTVVRDKRTLESASSRKDMTFHSDSLRIIEPFIDDDDGGDGDGKNEKDGREKVVSRTQSSTAHDDDGSNDISNDDNDKDSEGAAKLNQSRGNDLPLGVHEWMTVGGPTFQPDVFSRIFCCLQLCDAMVTSVLASGTPAVVASDVSEGRSEVTLYKLLVSIMREKKIITSFLDYHSVINHTQSFHPQLLHCLCSIPDIDCEDI